MCDMVMESMKYEHCVCACGKERERVVYEQNFNLRCNYHVIIVYQWCGICMYILMC